MQASSSMSRSLRSIESSPFVTVGEVNLKCYTHRTANDLDNYNNSLPDKVDLNIKNTTTSYLLNRVAIAWGIEQPILIQGPTGCGKTSIVHYLCQLTKYPCYRVNLSSITEISDLIGRNIIDKFNNVRWIDGPLIKAMDSGSVLLLDELNLAPQSIIQYLSPILSLQGNIFELYGDCSKKVRIKKGFKIIATMNPSGSMWGRNALPDYFTSRWQIITVDNFTKEDIKNIFLTNKNDIEKNSRLAELIDIHYSLRSDAQKKIIGKSLGDFTYSFRDLSKAWRRYEYFTSAIPDNSLDINLKKEIFYREVWEIYAGCLPFNEKSHVEAILTNKIQIPTLVNMYNNCTLKTSQKKLYCYDVAVDQGMESSNDRITVSRTKRYSELFYRVLKALYMKENILLVGDTAVGKSTLVKDLANQLEMPLTEDSYHQTIDASDLLGSWGVNGWSNGSLGALSSNKDIPRIYFARNFNLASTDVLERFNSLLDDGKSLLNSEHLGENLFFGSTFNFLASARPPSHQQGNSEYFMSEALRNRFTCIYLYPITERNEINSIIYHKIHEKFDQNIMASIPFKDINFIINVYYSIKDKRDYSRGTYDSDDLSVNIRHIERSIYSYIYQRNSNIFLNEKDNNFMLGYALTQYNLSDGDYIRELVDEYNAGKKSKKQKK